MTLICSIILAFMISIGGGANLSVHLNEKPHPGLKIETRILRPVQTELNQEQQPVLRFFIWNSRLRVRFLQTDPMGYEDSMNLYQAFNQNPVNFIDPMGELIKAEYGKHDVLKTEEFKTGKWWLDYTIVGAFNELRNTAALGINLGTNLLVVGGEVQEKVLDVADYGAHELGISNNRGDVKEALEFTLMAWGTNPNAVRMGTKDVRLKGKKIYKGVKDFFLKFFGRAKKIKLGSTSGHIVLNTTRSFIRKQLPNLKGSYWEAFEGPVRVRTYKKGDVIYRSPSLKNGALEAKDSPGPWFSTRATKTKFGTESQSHIKDWRNPLKVLRKYKFTQDVTVYYGKVRHGKGYQALFPSDIDPADVLAFIDEWSLK